ncbi:hypothetical protein AB0O01_08665 [Streptomyces sp. NPDC093252]|uniref:hypothetical protein n=1 Tax=Streptomyces sp. NPDC093252 TaxID=3154980 RepID=UPI00343C4717
MSGAGRGRRIAVVAGALLVAGAVVAGVGATVMTVRNADTDPGPPRWAFPKATAEKAQEPVRDGLAGMLVPYGEGGGWYRGPDIAHYGHDVELSGEQAVALHKESLRTLPRSARQELEKEIDRQGSKGIALRSYVRSEPGFYAYDEDAFTATVMLERRSDAAAVKESARLQRELIGTLTDDEGPAIKGHKEAGCSTTTGGKAADGSESLSMVFCSAAVGDVLVTVIAHGPGSFDRTGVADLVKTQLDRIAEPGKAV